MKRKEIDVDAGEADPPAKKSVFADPAVDAWWSGVNECLVSAGGSEAVVKVEVKAEPGLPEQPEKAVGDQVLRVLRTSGVDVGRDDSHPCLHQFGWCPFAACRWRGASKDACALWLRGKCPFGAQCAYSHADPPVGSPRPRLHPQLVWYSKRADAETARSPYADCMLARDLGTRGSKQFSAVSRFVVASVLAAADAPARNYYAVIPPDSPVDLYLDVDHRLGGDETASEIASARDELTHGVLDGLDAYLKRAAAAGLPQERGGGAAGAEGLTVAGFALLDATTDAKVSLHVHVKFRGFAFDSAASLRGFVAEVFHSSGDESLRKAVDASVYAPNSCFRLPYCTKKGRDAPLLPLSLRGSADPRLRALAAEWNEVPAPEALDAAPHTPAAAAARALVDFCWMVHDGGAKRLLGWAGAPPQGGGRPGFRVAATADAARPAEAEGDGEGELAPADVQKLRKTRFVWPALAEAPAFADEAAGRDEALEWQSQEWCKRVEGASEERSPSRNFLLARLSSCSPSTGSMTQAGTSTVRADGEYEYLYVPYQSVSSIVLSDRGRSYYAVVKQSSPLDLFVELTYLPDASSAEQAGESSAAGLSRLLASAVPILEQRCAEALGLRLRELLAVAATTAAGARLVRLHGRLAEGAAFSSAESLRAFVAGALPAQLAAVPLGGGARGKVRFPWSGPEPFTPVGLWTSSSQRANALPPSAGRPVVDVDRVFSLCSITRPDSIPRFVITAQGDLHRLPQTSVATNPLRDSPPETVAAAVLSTVQSLHPAYASLSSAGLSYSVTGTDLKGYSVRVHNSKHCLILDRAHKSTSPCLLLRPGGIYVKCFSNDCFSSSLRLDWPAGAALARSVLFPNG
ncbi:hypothetical protein DIPPA_13205 [Diplonema papillatum]|nr:hypothetical protein DIPPA_13205 [Diplonema papillatum]